MGLLTPDPRHIVTTCRKSNTKQDTSRPVLPLVQGAYYLLTGIWPIVHRASFEAITGPKQDYWLVVTVGLLVCTIGLELVLHRNQPSLFLGSCSALSFVIIDLVYTLNGRIRLVYLLDMIPELIFLALWVRRFAKGTSHTFSGPNH